MNKLTLYTKKNCHLCDKMKELLKRVQEDFEFELEEIDVETDKDLFEKYEQKIPVLMLDEKIFAKYRVEELILRKKLITQK